MDLPDPLIDLLRQSSPCYLATLMPNGSPQLTQTWVDTDGEHVLINTVQGFQKDKNIARDPATEGGAEHIEALAQRYLGGAYPWYRGRDQTRLILTITADRIHNVG